MFGAAGYNGHDSMNPLYPTYKTNLAPKVININDYKIQLRACDVSDAARFRLH